MVTNVNDSELNAKYRTTLRDRQIIEHIRRYRLTTLEVLERVVLPSTSRNSLSKITNRLCVAGLLQKYTLVHPTKYFVLGQISAHTIGIGEHRVAPLGPQSLPIEYAVLIYATLAKQPKIRQTQEELLADCPWLPIGLAKAPHCLDVPNHVLELVRVDLGGPADHVARKCAADLTRRRRIAEFTRLLQQQRFRLVVITATQGKASAVQQALDRHDWPAGLPIHLSIVPKLLTLLASIPHA